MRPIIEAILIIFGMVVLIGGPLWVVHYMIHTAP
jgi:hypothetical protein